MRIVRTFAKLIGLIGALITLVVTVLKLLDHSAGATRTALLLLAGINAFLVVLFVVQELRYAWKARVAEAVTHLVVISRVAKECRSQRHALLTALSSIADEIADAYSLITGVHVAACIKGVGYTAEGPGARTFAFDICRDRRSKDRWDRVRAYKQSHPHHVDWLDANSDFRDLWSQGNVPERDFVLSRNLPRRWDFATTSFAVYGYPPSGDTGILRGVKRVLKWPLPYSSTLVLRVTFGPEDDSQFLGFICIDSRARSAFGERYDVPFLRTISHIVAPLLSEYLQILAGEAAAPSTSGSRPNDLSSLKPLSNQ